MSGHLDGPPPGGLVDPAVARERARIVEALREAAHGGNRGKPGSFWVGWRAAARAIEQATVSPEVPDEGVWPDQSAVHGVLLAQVKDAYAEGIADTLDKLRVRAAEVLPEVARFTLDEIEAILDLPPAASPDERLREALTSDPDLLASSTAEKLAPPRKRSVSASDPMPLCDCKTTGRIPDAEFVEPPLMPPAASPDERLREAAEALSIVYVMLTGAEPMWAEMPIDERCARAANEAQQAFLAAADREAPDGER